VFKDLNSEIKGRDSPESGSLYSDYESGQQYEDKDLPSGYNSGEQYDTLSTGYMSGEAYELPEARPEPMEPTLASIDEVSAKSNEELFIVGSAQSGGVVSAIFGADNPQMERISSSSSSTSIPEIAGTGHVEMTVALENLAIHKAKRAKKQVSYHVSVPMDKSPLGNDGYRELPSDTDTTSCFDSDGTYIRSEAQSSDSGAALLSHSKRRGRKGGRGSSGGRGGAGMTRGIKKARSIIRSHEDFFRVHDNKYWLVARQACFWTSILSIVVCIGTAGVLIGLMPRSCDPDTEWWQGGVILDTEPVWRAASEDKPASAYLNLTDLIDNLPRFSSLGIQAIKLRNLYLKHENQSGADSNVTSWLEAKDEAIADRLDMAQLPVLTSSLHDLGMQLVVEIPVMEAVARDGMMSIHLIQNVTLAIKDWAERGVDGISLIGLEQFAQDPYFSVTAANWKVNFHKYGSSKNRKILTASHLLPQRLAEFHLEAESSAEAGHLSGYDGIASFELLDATLGSLGSEASLGSPEASDLVASIARWDRAPSQPWISWSLEAEVSLDAAELAVNMLLPGTVSLQGHSLDLDTNYTRSLVSKLTSIRRAAVPIYMNGNYKTCHAHCDGEAEKVDNYSLHSGTNSSLVMLERTFNRRNRYMVIANLGDTETGLEDVASLYSSGDVILDTSDLDRMVEMVKFKETQLQPRQALVIKFPK